VTRRALAALAALPALTAVILAATPAAADDAAPALVRMKFVERGNDLTVSAAFTKLFDSSAYGTLDNGFASTVVIRTWIYP
jgi:hypothetical protein